MPALMPVDRTLGSLYIATILSSIVYGVTLLQVYSYCNNHCSRDRWPLRTLVAVLVLIDSVNFVFANHGTYRLAVTNFGDYSAFLNMSWSLSAIAVSASVLEVCVQHFYAHRIYLLSGRSPYLPAAISVVSLTAFFTGTVLGIKGLEHVNIRSTHYRDVLIATLSCDALCDVLITSGMVYTLWKMRTPYENTKNVLNLLSIYAINCGTLNIVLTFSSIIFLLACPGTLIYLIPTLIAIQLYFCAFMAILNSRDHLRATLDRQEVVLSTSPTMAVTCGVQVTTETSCDTAHPHPKTLPSLQVASYSSFSGSIALDREKSPAPPLPAFFDGSG